MRSKMVCKTMKNKGLHPVKQVSLEIDDFMVFVVAVPFWVAKKTVDRWRKTPNIESKTFGTTGGFVHIAGNDFVRFCKWMTDESGDLTLDPEVGTIE
jgi:hypothetical protein